MISLLQAQKELNVANTMLDNAYKQVEIAKERVIKAESNRVFKCTYCKKSEKYKNVVLYQTYSTQKGLGYEDDYDQFNEWQIECPHCNVRHRFLSDKSLIDYNIPHETKDYYGKPKMFQREYGEEVSNFTKKFKECHSEYDNGNNWLLKVKRYKFTNH